MYLISMRTHQTEGQREGYREKRNGGMKGKKEERETGQEGEGCGGFIKGSWRPPGVSHLHPLIHRTHTASASPINMEPLQENESLLI